tara:strand:- start:542 stop:646 length:105 start_codon:yes stop_codon:yes gene_type:complete
MDKDAIETSWSSFKQLPKISVENLSFEKKDSVRF